MISSNKPLYDYQVGSIEEVVEDYEPIIEVINSLVVQEELFLFPIDIKRFSSATTAINVLAWVLRYVGNLRMIVKNRRDERITSPLTLSEIEYAEKKWISVAQKESFTDDGGLL